MLNRTYEWLKLFLIIFHLSKKGLNRTYEWLKLASIKAIASSEVKRVEPYLWVIETRTRFRFAFEILKSWTVPRSDWNQIGIPVDAGLLFGLNRTYEWYVAFAELIVLYEYYELFR